MLFLKRIFHAGHSVAEGSTKVPELPEAWTCQSCGKRIFPADWLPPTPKVPKEWVMQRPLSFLSNQLHYRKNTASCLGQTQACFNRVWWRLTYQQTFWTCKRLSGCNYATGLHVITWLASTSQMKENYCPACFLHGLCNLKRYASVMTQTQGHGGPGTNRAISLCSSCLCCWSSVAIACCACCCIVCTKCCMCWNASICNQMVKAWICGLNRASQRARKVQEKQDSWELQHPILFPLNALSSPTHTVMLYTVQ